MSYHTIRCGSSLLMIVAQWVEGEAKIRNLFYLHPVEAAAVNKVIF